MKRTLTGALLLGLLVTAPISQAQDREKKTIRIELKEGKVLIDGREVAESDADRLSIVDRNGKEYTVVIDGSGGRFWIGDGDEPFEGFLREGLFSGGHGNFRLRSDDGGAFHLRSDDGEPFFFNFGDNEFFEPGEFKGRLENLSRIADVPLLRWAGNREVMELERRIEALARRVRNADTDERAELEAELDELLDEAFEARLAAESERAAEMRESLRDMEARIAERREARQEIIARRKSDLLGQRHVLDW